MRGSREGEKEGRGRRMKERELGVKGDWWRFNRSLRERYGRRRERERERTERG